MGLRGPMPTTTVNGAPPLEDLTAPDWLCDEGKSYWDKHAEHLVANGLLTTATADSFALLSDLWARLQKFRDCDTNRIYLDTAKSYAALAKIFRAVPCDRPSAPVEHRHQNKKNFDF